MINVLGINHKTAPLDIRAGFAISEEEISPLSEKILQETEITELVILSTCNRTEIYYCNQKAYHNKETNRVLLGILHHFKQMKAHYTDYFYSYSREEAIKHLFRVTAGMDSMVLGEDQIVKQVKEAYLYCTKLSLTDAVLMRLFQKSFEVAKKVRSNTNIQQGPTSVSYVAVDLSAKLVSNLSDKKILLIGLGETGKLVLSNLRKKGAKNITLTNRTIEKAQKQVSNDEEKVVPFENFKKNLLTYDVIFTATNANDYLVRYEDIHKKGNKPVLFIDLAVPRNIDKSISEIDNIQLYGVDDFMTILNKNTKKRRESLKEAEVIINEMTSEYLDWLDVRALTPVIRSVTKNIQKINKTELENFKRNHSEETIRIIEEYSERLTKKYISSLVKKLKLLSNNGSTVNTLKTITELFAFEEEFEGKMKEVVEVINK